MTKAESKGMYQLSNGTWGFRLPSCWTASRKTLGATRTKMGIHLKQREQLL